MVKNRQTSKQTLRNFWGYSRKYPWYFSSATIGAVLAVLAQNVTGPYIVSRTFARLQQDFKNGSPIHLGAFQGYLIVYALVMLAGAILWRVQSYCTWQMEINASQDIVNTVFAKLISLSQRFHANSFSGALVSQSTKYAGAYERLMDDFIWNVIPAASTLFFSIAVLSFISPYYGLGTLVLTIIYLLLMYGRIQRQMPFNTNSAKLESAQTAALADAIANIETVRSFGMEEYERQRFFKHSQSLHQSNHRLAKEVFKSESLSHFQTNSFQVIAVSAGLAAVSIGHANISLLYLLISYTQAIVNQIYQFSRLVRNVNKGLGDAAEMTEILNLETEVKDPLKAKRSTIHRGSIEFDHVNFSYADSGGRKLFDDLSVRFKPGEKVGLVGPSGGGKTTITRLLLRFMDIDGGHISIDGTNIAELEQSDLRQHIAYVPQEPILFHRTLAENIAYGNHQAQMAEIKAVAKMAHADDFISRLPEGYDTLVGERGVKLSGGQRQRIAIARAMLKNAPILVLDEATSALDSVSEVLIQDALWKLMEQRTAIIIAHRLSTIQQMDRILVLANGQVVEEGTHKELLRLQGTYAELWSRQSGGFMED